MLTIKIAHVLNTRGIENHFTFLVKSGFNNHTAHNLLSSKTRSFRLDHIEMLCRILVCEPNDLVSYTPSAKYPLPDNHPLNNLIKNDENSISFKNTLRHLPYKELMNVSNKIAEEVNSKK